MRLVQPAIVAFFCILCAPFSATAATLSVSEAYQAIPQRQTTFEPTKSRLSASDSQYLEQFFSCVDRSIVQRVSVLEWFNTGGVKGDSFANYERQIEQIVSEIDMLPTPVRLRPAQNLISDALQKQKEFFTHWHKAKLEGHGSEFAVSARQKPHPLLQEASTMIKKAFQDLNTQLANEGSYNHQAFHDHLSALALVILRAGD